MYVFIIINKITPLKIVNLTNLKDFDPNIDRAFFKNFGLQFNLQSNNPCTPGKFYFQDERLNTRSIRIGQWRTT